MKTMPTSCLLGVFTAVCFGSFAHAQNYSMFGNFLPSTAGTQHRGEGTFNGVNFTYDVNYTAGMPDTTGPGAIAKETFDFSLRASDGVSPFFNPAFPHTQAASSSPTDNMLQLRSNDNPADDRAGPEIIYTLQLNFSSSLGRDHYILINNLEAEEVILSVSDRLTRPVLSGASINAIDLHNIPLLPVKKASIFELGNFPEALNTGFTQLTLQGSHWTEANASPGTYPSVDPNTDAFLYINPNTIYDTLTLQVSSEVAERLEFGLVTIAGVPEPSSAILVSLAALGVFRRKRA